jgi:hypothetical protein
MPCTLVGLFLGLRFLSVNAWSADTNETAVVQRALHLAELEEGGNYSVTASRIDQPERLIPDIPVEPIWRVRLENAPLQVRIDGKIKTNSFVRSYEMDFCERTGNLIRLKTDWPGDLPGVRFPTIGSYQLQTPGTEPVFLSLPEVPPKIRLSEALGKAHASVVEAKQIVIFYVLAAFPEKKPESLAKDLWVVHLAGIPPPVAKPLPGLSAEQLDWLKQIQETLTYQRVLIDAQTGSFEGSDGIPAP